MSGATDSPVELGGMGCGAGLRLALLRDQVILRS